MDQVGFFKSKQIPVHTPGETEYERAVATANLLYRFTRPACVVQPEHNFQVCTIVARARVKDIPLIIKNGGHSYAGFSTTNTGILLDLVNMKRVILDIGKKTVGMQGGALWGHAYKELVNDHHDRYIINGGRCPTVGVSGFTLGGGLGPFTRSFGMGSDTLQEATIVTANAELVTVSRDNGDDLEKNKLFWALCGAGGGNFGVLVELKMKLQELHGPEVVAGRFTWSPKEPVESMEEFMETMNTFYTAPWENEMTIDSSWLCDLSQQRKSEPAVRFLVYYNGKQETFDNSIDKYLGSAGKGTLAKQLKRRSLEEKSTRFLHETLVAQWSEETTRAFPSNPSFQIYTSFVFTNEKEKIEKITAILRQEMKEFRKKFTGEQGLLQVTWIHSGGKANERKSEDSAYPWRTCCYHTYIMIQWQEKFLEKEMRAVLERLNASLREYSISGLGAFINFADAALKDTAHERVYYGENHQDLRRVKAMWDKTNFFNWSQSVKLPPKILPAEKPTRMMSDNSARMVSSSKMEASWSSMMASTIESPINATTIAIDEEFVDVGTLTDQIAKDEWDTFKRPSTNEFVGGIQGLTDLGF
ncbi:hypothetical protein B0J13DRAFT_432338 [Dactylonectria estremocensis]|uniref:FAD-binding PCMH-type domain-containing protein n=1 Tax=Dactylonectria estremocensis TaxID=1079267 RepID=A0A9P9FDG6_9HYPO|nr:hypothetical protein B0J13DRAFT_432338 [Dactylonectria estremocensis]